VKEADTSALAALGLREDMEQDVRAHTARGLLCGRVARVDRGECTVLTAAGPERSLAPAGVVQVAVGDWVAIEPANDQSGAVVREVLDRQTQFIRGAAGDETLQQVIAANMDTVLVLNGVDQRISLRRIERYLTLAWQSGATPVVVLTKADLSPDLGPVIAEVESVTFGVPVVALCAPTGDGMEQLAPYLQPGMTAALLGMSGAGKSTLVNALAGEELQQVSEIRGRDGRGRHTTTHRELILLPGGALVIDTPGMRSVALWADTDGLAQTFGDVEQLAGECRFSDCTHDSEPGCAVTAAIRAGTLPAERLASYRKLERELRHQALKQDARARADERRRWRTQSRAMRRTYKDRE
jgi:ribosome biogenesis GTPase